MSDITDPTAVPAPPHDNTSPDSAGGNAGRRYAIVPLVLALVSLSGAVFPLVYIQRFDDHWFIALLWVALPITALFAVTSLVSLRLVKKQRHRTGAGIAKFVAVVALLPPPPIGVAGAIVSGFIAMMIPG
ncbi:hypothetical protein [Microbacterium karelineae]|uniref:hypothetical protein n=1 Tax=Microbacterium karelineae TaxID=2654283 RepID=UPI0012E9DFEE|nr:hypothetical protein [Microbacterium karelineae]